MQNGSVNLNILWLASDSAENLGKARGTPHPFRVYSRREWTR
uniref:Uncharacterized protein n=1 Tax=Manihot esculenta TaxID=3983 RepID=A0A2C9VNZ7_MANES